MLTNPTPRIERTLLLAWTVALATLAALQAGSGPPILTWMLLPYLALISRHLLAPARREAAVQHPAPAAAPVPPAVDAGPDPAASPPEPPAEADPGPLPTRPASARARRRPRPRAVADPAPAAWVEVAPGRFVRGEKPEPAPVEPTPTPEAPESDPPGPAAEGDPSEPADEPAACPAIDDRGA